MSDMLQLVVGEQESATDKRRRTRIRKRLKEIPPFVVCLICVLLRLSVADFFLFTNDKLKHIGHCYHPLHGPAC